MSFRYGDYFIYNYEYDEQGSVERSIGLRLNADHYLKIGDEKVGLDSLVIITPESADNELEEIAFKDSKKNEEFTAKVIGKLIYQDSKSTTIGLQLPDKVFDELLILKNDLTGFVFDVIGNISRARERDTKHWDGESLNVIGCKISFRSDNGI